MCGVWTWSIKSGLGVSSLDLGVWSPVCRVRTLCPDLRVLSPDSGVGTEVHTCSLESRLGRLDLETGVQTLWYRLEVRS